MQHHLEIGESRQHFFDSGQRDHCSRQRKAHAPVALRLHDCHRARLRDQEVRSADCRRHRKKLLPQITPRRRRKRFRLIGEILNPHAPREDFPHVAPIHVQRGNHDVRRLPLAQL